MSENYTNNQVSPKLLSLTVDEVSHLDFDASNGEGWNFYLNGCITRASVFKDRLAGLVRDNLMDHYVEVRFVDDELMTSCTCGDESICHHVVALLYSWVHDGDGFTDIGKKVEQLHDIDRGELIDIIGEILLEEPSQLARFLHRRSNGASPRDDDLDFDNEGILN